MFATAIAMPCAFTAASVPGPRSGFSEPTAFGDTILLTPSWRKAYRFARHSPWITSAECSTPWSGNHSTISSSDSLGSGVSVSSSSSLAVGAGVAGRTVGTDVGVAGGANGDGVEVGEGLGVIGDSLGDGDDEGLGDTDGLGLSDGIGEAPRSGWAGPSRPPSASPLTTAAARTAAAASDRAGHAHPATSAANPERGAGCWSIARRMLPVRPTEGSPLVSAA